MLISRVSKRLASGVCAAGVLILLLTVTAFNQSKPSPSVQGVWRVDEINYTGPNARTVRRAPGLFMFTARHYSTLRVQVESPRPMRPDLNNGEEQSKATADEIRSIWGPFGANAGIYEVSASTLTTRPIVAKNPSVMATGSFTEHTFKLEGSSLTLVTAKSEDGPVANPTTYRLTRIE
jgi:hypothetical protein